MSAPDDDQEIMEAQPQRAHARSHGGSRHEVWSFFKILPTLHKGKNKARPKCQCKLCGTPINNGQPCLNLKRHLLEQCDSISEIQKEEVEQMYKKRRVEGNRETVQPATRPENNLPNSPTLPSQTHFELQHARLIFQHNLSWSLVDSPTWKLHHKMMEPGYDVPPRQKLGGDLLNAVYEEVRIKTLAKIKQRQVVSVVTDVWTNSSRASIVVTAPGMKPLLWASHSADADRQMALEATISEIQRETTATVSGVLIHSTESQVELFKSDPWWQVEMCKADRPIFGGSCVVHALNQVMDDVLGDGDVKMTIDEAMRLACFVRDNRVMQASFNDLSDEDEHQLMFPCPSRWFSTVQELKRVLDNKDTLKFVLFNENKTNTKVPDSADKRTRVDGENQQALWFQTAQARDFWKDLKNLLSVLDPVIEALNDLKSNQAPSSRVYERFTWLLRHDAYANGHSTHTALQKIVFNVIEKHWNSIRTDAMGIAFLLDPCTSPTQFMGTDRNNSIQQAIEFVKRGSAKHPSMLTVMRATESEFVAAIFAYQARKRRGEVKVSRETEPRHWWQVMGNDSPLLQRLALHVFSIPTSTTAAGHICRIVTNIHEGKKNTTRTDRLDKLAFIYANNDFDEDAERALASTGVPRNE